MTDPIEAGLLEAIARSPADEHARSVYTDWLEEHGHTDELAFLRHETGAPRDPTWRLVVSRPPIRNCARSCGARWHTLEPTDNDLLRQCAPCGQQVVYALTIGRPPVPFVADAAVATALDQLPPPPMPTNPPAPMRQIQVPSSEPPKPGAFVRVLNWFRRR